MKSTESAQQGRHDMPDTRTCPAGHTWTTSTRDKYGCPHCSKRKPKPGAGIDSTHPDIAAQWSPTNGYPAALVSANANRSGWFLCGDHDHEYVGVVSAVVRRGGTCAVCTGHQIRAGFNDLRTLHPDVAAFWHQGNPCGPDEVAAFSHDVCRWECPVCHFEWRQSVAKRVRAGGKCTACAGRTLAPGINDFATLHPGPAAEWDGSNDRGPHEVLAGSGYRATWRCRVHAGFTWEAFVRNRADGTGCPICGGQLVVAGINDLPTTHPLLVAQWDTAKTGFAPDTVSANSGRVAWWTCDVHGAYPQRVDARARGCGCGACAKTGNSQGERELHNFLVALVGAPGCVTRYRGIPHVREVDVYVPARRIAIEFNGVYWHSERRGKGRDRDYHRAKYLRCREAGVQLIQVWEDDWRDRREAVEAMLSSKLGLDVRERIGARSCRVCSPWRYQVRDFLEKNHVQGHRDGTMYLGLRDAREELVAAMVVTRTKLTWTIDRYATAAPVQGGFGKLLAQLKVTIAENGGGRIVTYSDNEVSHGGLYALAGFSIGHRVPPGFSYLVGPSRVHRSNYLKERFQQDPALKFEEGLTVAELADLNGLHRVWDSGKIRWELEVAPAL